MRLIVPGSDGGFDSSQAAFDVLMSFVDGDCVEAGQGASLAGLLQLLTALPLHVRQQESHGTHDKKQPEREGERGEKS